MSSLKNYEVALWLLFFIGCFNEKTKVFGGDVVAQHGSNTDGMRTWLFVVADMPYAGCAERLLNSERICSCRSVCGAYFPWMQAALICVRFRQDLSYLCKQQ